MAERNKSENKASVGNKPRRKAGKKVGTLDPKVIAEIWEAHVFQGGDGTEPGGNLLSLDEIAKELESPRPMLMTRNLWFHVLSGPSHPERTWQFIEDEAHGLLSESRASLYREQRIRLVKEVLFVMKYRQRTTDRSWTFRYLPWGGDWVDVNAVLTRPEEIGGERLVLMAPGES